MIIVGIILIGLSVILFFVRRRSLNKIMNIRYHQTSKVIEVLDEHKMIKENLGEGNFNKIVELSGVATSDNPLEAEHSGNPVLYYRTTVSREFEVRVQKKDNNDNYYWDTERRTDVISSNERYVPFHLDDNSGAKIKVDMEGAEKIAQKSFDRFEHEAPRGFSVSFGSDSKTLGYRYEEFSIPNKFTLYVLGEASDRRGNELMVIKPNKEGENFIVSTKSEDELIKSEESTSFWLMVGSISSIVGGLGLIVSSFFVEK